MPERIIDEAIFYKRKTIINPAEIKNITRVKVWRGFRRNYPIADGFSETTLEIGDEHILTISPDFYENYTELIMAIRSITNLQQHEA